MSRPDSRRGLSRINCPTLVVCGRQDILTPPELSEEITAHIPNADLILIEACGHLSTMERPKIVNTAMRAWLTT
jgi:pimeloyl-ACP methyl ester carboxylesterase